MTAIMKRTEPGLPFLSFCMIVRNEAQDEKRVKRFETCFESIRARAPQAEIVVVDTCSSDDTAEIAQRYADVFEVYKGPRGDWNPEMLAFDDAAAARQRSFELASGRYRGWIDGDDRLAGPEEAERLLRLNNRWQPPPRGKRSSLLEDPAQGTPMDLVDVLRHAEKVMPEADVFWAPYLYQRNPDGTAMVWQTRERIVRWDSPPKWRWAEAAHELLVPVPGHVPNRVELSSLLYVHEKEFSEKEIAYNIKRHFDIMLAQYDRGDRTTRRCLYMAEAARVHAPGRELEFIRQGHELATTPTDRYRCRLHEGVYWSERGLYWDAMEQFGAAIQLRPDLPDAWIAGADQWSRIDDSERAVKWFRTALELPYNEIESYVAARHMVVRYPAALARELEKRARVLAKKGEHEESLACWAEATRIYLQVAGSDAIGTDKSEANAYAIRAHNDEEAQRHAMALLRLADFLFANDEPLKVAQLLKAVPWNLRDHPITIELERRLRPILQHVTDPQAYLDFYRDKTLTGFLQSPDEWLEPGHCVPRATWMAAWINEHCPKATVIDVGAFDGIVGIPLLKLCPKIRYCGIDPFEEAIDIFRGRIAALGFADRAEVRVGEDPSVFGPQAADVIIWSEVIEHVPDPLRELQTKLYPLMKWGGWILVTTPWGSFDKGMPFPETHEGYRRDERGHVRVLTAREITEIFEQSWEVEELQKEDAALGRTGDSLNFVARKIVPPAAPPMNFVVPGALWDWSGSVVRQQGMGASEGMIVYLAEALADGQCTSVYGPVPEPEIHRKVRYWPREHLRHIKAGKLIVSRSPSTGAFLDEFIGVKLPKILWLQDAYYPDLSPESAALYEKIVVVSDWHLEAMATQHGVSREKMITLYNFLLPEHYAGPAPVRSPHRFVYASSPERGLVRVLELWPAIKKRIPNATLDVCYGWRGCERLGLGTDAAWTQHYERSRRRFEAIKHQEGVTYHGMVNHARLIEILRSSGVWLHPSITAEGENFHETCCTLALEARAAGCIPVVQPVAGLAETALCKAGFFVDPRDADAFVEACELATLCDPGERQQMSEEALDKFSLSVFLPKWRELLAP